jgi:putative N6-adenine-specific DNA methylase
VRAKNTWCKMATSSSSSTTRLFATCTRGLETLLQKELTLLGIQETQTGASGVYLPYTLENVYKVNYCSRLTTRLLLPLARFPCKSREDLYKQTAKIDWTRFLTLETSFAVDANVQQSPAFTNSHFASLVVKDAICDQLRKRLGGRPFIEKRTPDIQLNLYIQKNDALLHLDTSGAPLFKRGWREATIDAPLQETLAAALLFGSGYLPSDVLFDPFCGSATFLVEAAMIASQTPAGFYRKRWGFFHLPEHTEEAWLAFKEQEDAKRISLQPGKLFGVDENAEALDSAYANLCKAGFADAVTLIERPIEQLRHPIRPTLIVTNPPYGIRLEADREVLRGFGQWIKRQKARAYILYPSEGSLQEVLDLECKHLFSFYNGGIEVGAFRTKS